MALNGRISKKFITGYAIRINPNVFPIEQPERVKNQLALIVKASLVALDMEVQRNDTIEGFTNVIIVVIQRIDDII